ncbi:DegT/DnrJ/EryC1/StrS family aminotransferase [Palleronia caenipelagi]|uniref:Aminotransferase class I/II-fold pyridoxal phosphate-dependent enzyme n=1 Tax=Palleronia caenipelagi TaxID=2489174 RepID=A0A547PNA7_9RHOB|nr:DegT/DnrJ/EryC1/StrS family aminotransferase [Palleronia caenipelagi]TRD15633.1 hypothetical protein FEV53_15525 [Palleronia caenipelagi]
MSLRLLSPDFPAPENWVPYLAASYDAGQFSNFGPNERELSCALMADLDNGREPVLVSSATAGLTGVLMALGIRGKVAVPAFTFPATASAVFQAGAEPVAVDCDLRTWEMCPEALRQTLEAGGISAVFHVRSFGYCRDISEIERVVEAHDLPLIVDAAAAYGGEDPDGRRVGYAGVAEVFSFHATKPFAIGEGGAVFVAPELAAEVRTAINFGLAGGAGGDRWGLNGKLSETTAAIGRATLAQFPETLSYRRAQAAGWHQALADIAGDAVMLPSGHGNPPWQLFSFRVPGVDAAAVKAALADEQIDSRVYYTPTVSSRWQAPEPPNAVQLSQDMLSLPMGRHVTPSVQIEVAGKLRRILDKLADA